MRIQTFTALKSRRHSGSLHAAKAIGMLLNIQPLYRTVSFGIFQQTYYITGRNIIIFCRPIPSVRILYSNFRICFRRSSTNNKHVGRSPIFPSMVIKWYFMIRQIKKALQMYRAGEWIVIKWRKTDVWRFKGQGSSSKWWDVEKLAKAYC